MLQRIQGNDNALTSLGSGQARLGSSPSSAHTPGVIGASDLNSLLPSYVLICEVGAAIYTCLNYGEGSDGLYVTTLSPGPGT